MSGISRLKNSKFEELGLNDWGFKEIIPDDMNSEIVETEKEFPDSSILGNKIKSLSVDKLISGSITSKQIDLTFVDTQGDVYFGCGTYTASTWTANNGFLFGIDDSDSNKVKAYFGTNTSWWDWNVTTANKLTITDANISGTLTVGSLPILPSDSNLLGYWSFDEGSGSSVYDYKNGNTGTVSSATFVAGVVGTGLDFDGASGSVLVSDHASIQNIWDGGASFSCIINPTSVGENSNGYIINKSVWGITKSDPSGGYLRINVAMSFSGTNGIWTTDRIIPYGTNTNTSICVVFDNSSVANDPLVYVNGVSVTVNEDQTPVGTRTTDVGSDMYFGNEVTDARTFDGILDEFRLYDYALTLNEVKGLYLNPAGIQQQGVASDRGIVGSWVITSTTLSNGNITLDAGNETILIGSATAPLTGDGIFLGKDSSDYEFRVGDPDTDYMHWDGTVLFESNSAFVQKSLGGGIRMECNTSILQTGFTETGNTITYNTFTSKLNTDVVGNSSNLISDSEIDGSADFSFAVRSKFEQGGTVSASSCYVGIDGGTATVDGVHTADHTGIYVYGVYNGSSYDWKGYLSNADGTSQTKTEITGITFSNYNDYKTVKTSTSVKLYVNGVLKATNTTNLPDDTTMGFEFSAMNTGVGNPTYLTFYNNFRLANG